MNVLKVAIIVATILCGPSAPALAQTEPSPDGLQVFNEFMESLRPELLLEYAVETELSFTYDGEAVASRQTHRCHVIHDKGSLTERRDQVIGVTGGSDSHHVVLADGRTFVFFGMNPCTWIEDAPEFGRDYTLRAIPDDRIRPMSPAGDIGTIKGGVLILDDSTTPKEVQVVDMSAFLSSTVVSGLDIVARATTGEPINTLAADVPALSAAVALAVYYEQSNGNIQPEQFGNYLSLTDQAAQGGVVFYRVGSTEPRSSTPDAAEMAQQADGWAISIGGTGRRMLETFRATVGTDPARVDIDLTTTNGARLMGVALSFGRPQQAVSLGSRRRLEPRDISVCIEGQCLPARLSVSSGQGSKYYTLSHVPTGRTLEFTILTDDLTTKVR